MGELTRIQLSEIAQVWREIARTLAVWQATHWSMLNTVQHFDLNAYQNSLLTRAQDIDERSYLLLSEPGNSTFSTTLRLLERASEILRDTTNSFAALNIGALAVALAAGIARNNTRTIQLALSELRELVEGDVPVEQINAGGFTPLL